MIKFKFKKGDKVYYRNRKYEIFIINEILYYGDGEYLYNIKNDKSFHNKIPAKYLKLINKIKEE